MPPARRISSRRPTTAGYALQVNAYDRASSVLVALLAIAIAIVAGLVIVFFTARVVTVTTAIPVVPVNPPPRPQQSAAGAARDRAPGVENAPQELVPEVSSTLNLMAGLVAARTSLFDDESLESPDAPSRGEGLGDARGVSDEGGDQPPLREPLRQLRYEPASLEEYAEWLDSAGIELGVLGEDNRVYYAASLARAAPALREGDPADDLRLYFNSRGGPLEPLDRQLVRKAGIAERGEIILLFCGAETQRKLLELEKQKAGDRPIEDISLTVFRVELVAGNFKLSVEEQRYVP